MRQSTNFRAGVGEGLVVCSTMEEDVTLRVADSYYQIKPHARITSFSLLPPITHPILGSCSWWMVKGSRNIGVVSRASLNSTKLRWLRFRHRVREDGWWVTGQRRHRLGLSTNGGGHLRYPAATRRRLAGLGVGPDR